MAHSSLSVTAPLGGQAAMKPLSIATREDAKAR